MKRVAFIGLGRMGHGMAGRYLDAGFQVAMWNRSKAKGDDLIARGARWAASPGDAAVDADAVVTMVADDEVSRSVWLGKDGAASTMKPGTLAIECSTSFAVTRSSLALEVVAVPLSRALPVPEAPTEMSSGLFGSIPLYSRIRTSALSTAAVKVTVTILESADAPAMFFA